MALWLYDPFEASRPSRILDQHFGSVLDRDDFLTPLLPREFRSFANYPAQYLRPSLQDTGSSVNFDEDKFRACIDVQQFKPDEITVKTSKDEIIVEGKHEEQRDEHGLISRHFIRRYVMPKGYDIKGVETKLSSDGVLTVTAPKIEAGKVSQRSVPVIQTGHPSKAVEQNEIKDN